jgi:hypothetical protein
LISGKLLKREQPNQVLLKESVEFALDVSIKGKELKLEQFCQVLKKEFIFDVFINGKELKEEQLYHV